MVAEVLELLAAVARRAVRRLHGRSRRPRPRAARGGRDARCSASIAISTRSRSRARRWRRSAIASSSCTPTTASWIASSTSAAIEGVAGILADLGVSSMQFDAEGRGFSFRRDEPLDMRMDQSRGPSVADLLRDVDETELADVIYRFGEERASRRVARAIVHARRESPIDTTGRLAAIVRRAGAAPGAPADRSGDAHVPGAAHLGQPRARRAGRVPGGGGAAAAGRARGSRSSRSTRSKTASSSTRSARWRRPATACGS